MNSHHYIIGKGDKFLQKTKSPKGHFRFGPIETANKFNSESGAAKRMHELTRNGHQGLKLYTEPKPLERKTRPVKTYQPRAAHPEVLEGPVMTSYQAPTQSQEIVVPAGRKLRITIE